MACPQSPVVSTWRTPTVADSVPRRREQSEPRNPPPVRVAALNLRRLVTLGLDPIGAGWAIA